MLVWPEITYIPSNFVKPNKWYLIKITEYQIVITENYTAPKNQSMWVVVLVCSDYYTEGQFLCGGVKPTYVMGVP